MAPSASVTVGISNGPANASDWVGLYRMNNPGNTAYLDYFYLNNSKSPPATGQSSATLTFTMPSTLGDYEFRFFGSNGYTSLAVSTTITVTPP